MNLRVIINRRNIFLISLIIIGVIAILVSIYILNLKPYIAELDKRDRDPARIKDITLVDSALTKLKDADPNVFLGDQNRVYVSIPSYSANCSGLELPSLPENFEYRCKTEADYLKIDGNGWLPINFTKLPENSKFKSTLPVDPTNTAYSGYYYAYTIGEKNDFVIASLLESDEYLKKTALKDGGTDPVRLEVGSNLQLWAKVSGLVGYWNFDEGEGDIITSFSGNNGVLKGINKPIWAEGKGIRGTAIDFDGSDNYISIENETNLQPRKPYTLEAWVKASTFKPNSTAIAIYENASNYISLGVENTGNWNFLTIIEGVGVQIKSNTTAQTDTWVHLVGTLDSTDNMNLYINGTKQAETGISSDLTGLGTVYMGWLGYPNPNYYFNSLIDEVRIYSRALSEAEIRVIYNATK